MRCITLRAAGLAVVAALAIPAAAVAHPGIYKVTQKVAGAGVTFQTDPTGGGLTSRTQYVVANDGWTAGFTETSGSSTVGGMLNYKEMPTSYRADMTPDQKRTFPAAQTNLQPHATCDGVAQLSPLTPAGGANILAWQLGPGTTPSPSQGGAPVADPYFNYIPWQKTGVTFSGAPAGTEGGLGEDPGLWIPVVKAATVGLSGQFPSGVDLSALSTVTDFTNACSAIGGSYKVADAASNIAGTLVAKSLLPFQAQVASLQADLGTAQGEITTLQGDKAALTTAKEQAQADAAAAAAARTAAEQKLAAAEAARKAAEDARAAAEAARTTAQAEAQAASTRKLAVSLLAKRFSSRPGAIALVTGPAGTSVTLTLRGKGGKALGSTTATLGSQGAAVKALAPRKALVASGKPASVTVEAVAGAEKSTIGGTLIP